MATTKKKTTSKATGVKKSVAKKPSVKSTVKRKASTRKKSVAMQSFRIAQDVPAFTTFQITRQTIYWIILVSFIIFAQLWILQLQIEVASLLDAQQTQLQEM
jgi:hypothetical protein